MKQKEKSPRDKTQDKKSSFKVTSWRAQPSIHSWFSKRNVLEVKSERHCPGWAPQSPLLSPPDTPTRLDTNPKDREDPRQALHREGEHGRVRLGSPQRASEWHDCPILQRWTTRPKPQPYDRHGHHPSSPEKELSMTLTKKTIPPEAAGIYILPPKPQSPKTPEILAIFLSADRSKSVAHRTDLVTQTNRERKVLGFYHKDYRKQDMKIK